MDTRTAAFITTLLPPELVAEIEAYLIAAYYEERPRIEIPIKDYYVNLPDREFKNKETGIYYYYFVCGTCGRMNSMKKLGSAIQHTIYCNHTKQHYENEYWKPRTKLINDILYADHKL